MASASHRSVPAVTQVMAFRAMDPNPEVVAQTLVVVFGRARSHLLLVHGAALGSSSHAGQSPPRTLGDVSIQS